MSTQFGTDTTPARLEDLASTNVVQALRREIEDLKQSSALKAIQQEAHQALSKEAIESLKDTVTRQETIIEALHQAVAAQQIALTEAVDSLQAPVVAPVPAPAAVDLVLSPRRPRNLVVCIDGTSNQFSVKNTNVVELYHRLIHDEHQLTFYNSGIGTYATPSWKSWKFYKQVINNKIDLAIAWNFEHILLGAYRWLSENYEDGDVIYLFGFSRGAYQIRTLSAMINLVGLIRKGNQDQIPFAYELYAETKKINIEDNSSLFKKYFEVVIHRSSKNDTPSPPRPTKRRVSIAEMCLRFKETFSRKNVKVYFVGAWDTVSSVGFIRSKTLPGTTDGMQHVTYFRHALALHERRIKFLHENCRGGLGPTEDSIKGERPHTKEVWFAGSHGDIGGGAVSNLDMDQFGPALRWMLFEAAIAGLRFSSAPQQWENDKNPEIHNALKGIWRALEYLPLTRLNYTDNNSLTSWPHLSRPRQVQHNQMIHSTAIGTQEVWRALLPQGMEWKSDILLKNKMVEADPYVDAKNLIARLKLDPRILQSHDLAALKELISTVPGIRSLRDLASAQRDLMDLGALYPSTSEASYIISEAALAIFEFDAEDDYRTSHLLPIFYRAEEQGHKELERLKELLASALKREVRGCLESSTDILDSSSLQTLKLFVSTEDKSLQGFPDSEIAFMSLVERYAKTSDPKGLHVVADAVLLVLDVDSDGDKHYSMRQLEPVIERAHERGLSEIEDRILTVFQPAQAYAPLRHPDSVQCVAYTPDGEKIVSGCNDGIARVWDVKTGTIVGAPIAVCSGRIWDIAISPDGSAIALVYDDEKIWLMSVVTGTLVGLLEGHHGWVRSAAFSPNGTQIVSGSTDQAIRVWDVASCETIVGPIEGHRHHVSSVAYSPDGSRIISGSSDCSIRLWDAKTGEELWQAGAPSYVNTIAYSPDATRIAAGCRFGSVLLLDAETGDRISEAKGSTQWVYSVAFSHDSKSLASTSRDSTVRLWDVETGEELDILRGHRSDVVAVTFSPDDKYVASASGDKTVRVWDATGVWKAT